MCFPWRHILGQRMSACHRLFFKQELLSAATCAFKQNSTHLVNAGKDDSLLERCIAGDYFGRFTYTCLLKKKKALKINLAMTPL